MGSFQDIIVFLHGGPESIEFDEGRHAYIQNQFHKIGKPILILNYLGSSGFGLNFKNKANGSVINDTIQDILIFINKFITKNPYKKFHLISGSFGATLAFFIAKDCSYIKSVSLINPLIDLRHHYAWAKKNNYDISWFDLKFGENDYKKISIENIAEIINPSIRYELIIGKKDKLIDPSPSYKLNSYIQSKKFENVTFTYDQYDHAGSDEVKTERHKLLWKKLVNGGLSYDKR